jgi:hypothetical protein
VNAVLSAFLQETSEFLGFFDERDLVPRKLEQVGNETASDLSSPENYSPLCTQESVSSVVAGSLNQLFNAG